MPHTFYPSSYLVLTTNLQASYYYLDLAELETGTERILVAAWSIL